MDIELLQASQTGNVEYLHQLIRDYPFVLDKCAVFSTENPLHIASAAGHVGFVKELIKVKPELAKEISQDGFSPMHTAAANGYVEIVEELLKVEPGLCRLEGNGKRTPLHCAAIKGRNEVISAMLLACPDCIADVNVQKETALHLACYLEETTPGKLNYNLIQVPCLIFNQPDPSGSSVSPNYCTESLESVKGQIRLTVD